MNNIVTFIIPVRHQDNAKDWSQLKKNLTATIRSIAQQDNPNWQAIIVANHGADLPALPKGFSIKHVDFAPNQMHDMGTADLEKIYDAFRFDKGRRVLAGMLDAGQMGHVMIVDDDDFVSKRLVSFVAQHPKHNGWNIRDGYVWSEGDRFMYRYSDFSHFCGTSHIVRADLYALPPSFEAATETYIKKMLGSHIFLADHLQKTGNGLDTLPFYGAVYRVGHAGAHSKSGGVIRMFFWNRIMMKRPFELIRRILRLRPMTRSLEAEFFGA